MKKVSLFEMRELVTYLFVQVTVTKQSEWLSLRISDCHHVCPIPVSPARSQHTPVHDTCPLPPAHLTVLLVEITFHLGDNKKDNFWSPGKVVFETTLE